jgi:hypothetical protein
LATLESSFVRITPKATAGVDIDVHRIALERAEGVERAARTALTPLSAAP